jgi:electron transport complex protein RnfC
VEKERPDLARKLNPRDCIQCGCCSYVCPSRRPLAHFFKLAQERTKSDKAAVSA